MASGLSNLSPECRTAYPGARNHSHLGYDRVDNVPLEIDSQRFEMVDPDTAAAASGLRDC
jgi:hypothetical protein